MDDAAKLPEPYTREEVEALRVGSAMSTIRRLIATLDMRDADCEQKVAEAESRAGLVLAALTPTPSAGVCHNCDGVYLVPESRDDDGLCGPCHAAANLDRMYG